MPAGTIGRYKRRRQSIPRLGKGTNPSVLATAFDTEKTDVCLRVIFRKYSAMNILKSVKPVEKKTVIKVAGNFPC